MLPNFDSEFLTAYQSFRGSYIPEEAMIELANYYPDRYGRLTIKDFNKPEIAGQAGEDYLTIVKGYLRFYRIPMTMESIVAAFEWGIGNLRKNGLYKAPRIVKKLIADMRHSLQPQSEDLDGMVDK